MAWIKTIKESDAKDELKVKELIAKYETQMEKGNSYIGVYQNGTSLGTYTIMASGLYQDTFNLTLDAGIPVEIYYFEVGGPQTPPEEVQFQTWHNSFKLINSDSVVLMHEGRWDYLWV